DELVQRLLERARAQQLVYLHVPPLPDAERPVGRLVLHGRVPPAVEVEHVVGARQRQPRAARLQRQQEQRRPRPLALEARHHAVARRRRRPPVQEQRLPLEGRLQVLLQQLAHLRVLREDQRPVANSQHILQHLRQPRQLAAAARQRARVVQQERRVVADLLQLRERRQDLPPPLDALDLVHFLQQRLHDRLVERRLLPRQRAVHLHLVLLGQVLDDRLVRLQPPQDK